MLKVLGFDFETQGTDHTQTNPTEIGAVLCEVDQGELVDSWKVVKEENHLLWQPGYPPQSEEIIALTGITDEMLKRDGYAPKAVFLEKIFPLIEQADVLMAHN